MTDLTVLDQHNDISAAEDSVRQFMRQLRQHPRLTPEQELQLAKQCAGGDRDAIHTMVVSNLQLVVSIAREYAGRGVPMMDMIQEGSIGLITAAKKFDYTRNVRFSTYATKWIRQGVARCVMEHNAMIRVPHYTAERMNKVLRAKHMLLQTTGQEPELEEVAEACDMEPEKVQQLLNLVPQVCSLDAPVGEAGEDQLQILIEDLQAPQPEEALVRRELEDTMQLLLSMLTDRQQQVLRMRYGMADGTAQSLQQIANTLGISKERARQIEKEAMDKLKKMGADFGLEDFLI